MVAQLILLCVVIAIIKYLAIMNQKHGFHNLRVHREVSKRAVHINESFEITTVVENNKKFPISFLVVKEKIPSHMKYLTESSDGEFLEQWRYYESRYNVWSYERVKRTYKVKFDKRGVYILNELELTIGDLFGLSSNTKDMLDSNEIIVYPDVIPIENYIFKSTSYFGDNIIKRWIQKDPLYIKGIREYTVEDRMKDIHWKSSMKMNKLMVKEYDFTSEREITIVVAINQGGGVWTGFNEVTLEKAAMMAASLATKFINSGISTGIWTNSKLFGVEENIKTEVSNSTGKLKSMLELCARLSVFQNSTTYEYLKKNMLKFRGNCTYIIISDSLDKETANLLGQIAKRGIDIKTIDISTKLDMVEIKGIEKIEYRGIR